MILLVVFVFAMVVAIGAGFGYAIIQPITKASLGQKFRVRFYTCDFFSLSFLLALLIGIVTSIRQVRGGSMFVDVIGFIFVGVFIYAWARTALALSAIGIIDTWKRSLFLGILLPIAIFGSAIVVPTLIIMTFSVAELRPPTAFYWLVGMIGTPALAVVCRKGSQWVVSSNELPKNMNL